MRRIPALPALLAACCAWAAGTAHADGMRCGSRLVSEGDYLYEVRERCGEPDAASQRVELRTVRSFVNGPCYQEQGQVRCGRMVERTIEVVIDEWVYDRGEHKFVRYLTFEQGRLFHVRTGRYGSKDS
jgi:Protein of unknown function (DUF2845)